MPSSTSTQRLKQACHLRWVDDPEAVARWEEFWRTGKIDVVWLQQRFPPPSKLLRRAVREAVAAYHRTGSMLDAALAYARFGFAVFPCSVTTKKPIPARDPDPTGKYPKGIPGTGGFKKATTERGGTIMSI